MSDGRRAFESDRKLIGILRAIREGDATRLTGIADELGMAKSTAHYHLNTLAEHGFVARDGDDYRIGLRFLDYGVHARAERPLFAAARERVDELAERTEERAWCLTEERGRGVYLYGAAGRHAVRTYERVGQHVPLHNIAAGKAILAHLPDERVDEILGRELTGTTANTITDRERLAEELAAVRDRGVAFNVQESIDGLHAVGAPVRAPDGGVYGAISVGGPANRLTRERLRDELADLILGTANEIEINIRHTGP